MLIIVRCCTGLFGYHEQVYAIYNGTRKQAMAACKELNAKATKWTYSVGRLPMITPKE